jgi:CHAT domain-containing protein
VPFGALVAGEEQGYLGERMPLSQTTSLTALLGVTRRNRSALDTQLWSVGDPDTASPDLRLPGARAEALSIADLHPGPARVLLGSAAQ